MFKHRDVQNEEDDDNCVHYGTAFPPLEEDEQPIRKPLPIHEQTVTDERGRQRFHGAFTGGFSAGFFNTVGSKEGFEPATFQSSRTNRQSMKQRSVNDFMDEEDINEFGIAPKRLKVNEEFISNKLVTNAKMNTDIIERHIQVNPVDLGIRLLRGLGVRDGKGVGANVERELNIGAGTSEENADDAPIGKVYTCARPPPEFELMAESDIIEPDIMRKFKLAPDDISSFIVRNPKSDRKGLGYVGLNPQSFVGKEGSGFVSRSVTGMSGQAFGVGAFEDDDDDIYAQENLNDYDFELGPSRPSDRRDANKVGIGVAEGFVKASKEFKIKTIQGPKLPKNYKPSVPKAVLDSCSKTLAEESETEKKPLIFAGVRSKEGIIEPVSSTYVKSEPISSSKNGTARGNELVKGSDDISGSEKLEWRANSSEKQFKPSILPTNSRFVSAGKLDTLSNRVIEHEKIETTREKAARMKMFGKLTRSVMPYQFASVVCKRFNVKLTAENSYEPKANDQTVKNMFNRGVSNRQTFESHSHDVSKTSNYQNRANIDPDKNDERDSSKVRHQSLQDRTVQKSNFLSFLNDSELPEPKSHQSDVVEIKRIEQSKSNVESRETSVCSLKEKQANERSDFESVEVSNVNNEENADCQTLDSLKNLNLLLDVFGDDDDNDSDNDINDNVEINNANESRENRTFDSYHEKTDSVNSNIEGRSSVNRLNSKDEVVSNNALFNQSRIHSSSKPEDLDCFSKFFEVPDSQITSKSSSINDSNEVSFVTERGPIKEESNVDLPLDSEEEFGPCLPPPLNSANLLSENITCGNSSALIQNIKQEVESDSNLSKTTDVLFVKKIYSELKHKKKKKEKKHKKSKKS